jgi:hypothetical protein
MRGPSSNAVLILLLVAVCTSANTAQKSGPPKGKISPAQILERHLAAVGVADLKNPVRSLAIRGSFGSPSFNALGDFHFYYRAPESDSFQLDTISYGQSSIGHAAGTRFFKHAGEKIGGFNGVTLEVLEDDWLGLIENEYNDAYGAIELVGLTEMDKKWSYAVRFTPKTGDPKVRYYNCDTFLIVRTDSVQRVRLQKNGQEIAYKVESYYTDYRDSDGIRLPRKIRVNASEGDFVLDVQGVHVNSPVEDPFFASQ